MTNLAEFIEGHRDNHLAELCQFLRIPSVSAKSEHKPDIERAARWVADNLRAAGFQKIEIVPTNLHPLVYAESLEAPGKPTVLFYGHYDVQPAEPLDLWTSPAFEPTVRNGNLFGRGTADGCTGAVPGRCNCPRFAPTFTALRQLCRGFKPSDAGQVEDLTIPAHCTTRVKETVC